ncbi:hypothetical protein [Psychroserpens sp.]|uniref:hypothetical protein n=2 Tax=Psychroserpens sp. TaxID=2020870 RepID=UPI003C76AFFD
MYNPNGSDDSWAFNYLVFPHGLHISTKIGVDLDSIEANWLINTATQEQLDAIADYLNSLDHTVDGNYNQGDINHLLAMISHAISDETLSFSPFVKYPSGSNYFTLYPKLTEYLKNQLPTIKDNTVIIIAIKTYTNLTTSQIQEHLKWGEGPTIRVEQIGEAYGEFRKATDTSSIYLDIDLVNQLENSISNTSLANAFAFLIGVTILHEYVHYGDYNYNGDLWQFPQEEGLLFENDVYGQSVWIHNAKIILKNN